MASRAWLWTVTAIVLAAAIIAGQEPLPEKSGPLRKALLLLRVAKLEPACQCIPAQFERVDVRRGALHARGRPPRATGSSNWPRPLIRPPRTGDRQLHSV